MRAAESEPQFDGPKIWVKAAGIPVRLTPPTSRLTGERAVRWAKAWAKRHPTFPMCVWVSEHESLWIRPGAETGWYSRVEEGPPALPGVRVGRKPVEVDVTPERKEDGQ